MYDRIECPNYTFLSKPRWEKYKRKSGGIGFFISVFHYQGLTLNGRLTAFLDHMTYFQNAKPRFEPSIQPAITYLHLYLRILHVYLYIVDAGQGLCKIIKLIRFLKGKKVRFF